MDKIMQALLLCQYYFHLYTGKMLENTEKESVQKIMLKVADAGNKSIEEFTKLIETIEDFNAFSGMHKAWILLYANWNSLWTEGIFNMELDVFYEYIYRLMKDDHWYKDMWPWIVNERDLKDKSVSEKFIYIWYKVNGWPQEDGWLQEESMPVEEVNDEVKVLGEESVEEGMPETEVEIEEPVTETPLAQETKKSKEKPKPQEDTEQTVLIKVPDYMKIDRPKEKQERPTIEELSKKISQEDSQEARQTVKAIAKSQKASKENIKNETI